MQSEALSRISIVSSTDQVFQKGSDILRIALSVYLLEPANIGMHQTLKFGQIFRRSSIMESAASYIVRLVWPAEAARSSN